MKQKTKTKKPEACSLRKFSEIYQLLARLIREKRHITDIRSVRGGITIDPTDIKRVTDML